MHDYSTKLRDLLSLARPRLAVRHRLEFKRCFGAVAGYVDGNIFVSCGKFGVALRLPSQTLNELFREEDVLHLKYFPNGHVKKEYAVIPSRIIEDQGRFRKLVDSSIKYASLISSN
jgi:TfoX N-terminal domain